MERTNIPAVSLYCILSLCLFCPWRFSIRRKFQRERVRGQMSLSLECHDCKSRFYECSRRIKGRMGNLVQVCVTRKTERERKKDTKYRELYAVRVVFVFCSRAHPPETKTYAIKQELRETRLRFFEKDLVRVYRGKGLQFAQRWNEWRRGKDDRAR